MNNYQSIYTSNPTTQIPSYPLADNQEPGALGTRDVVSLDEGQTTRSNTNVPWQKITIAVVGLVGLGLSVYYGSDLLPKLASGMIPDPADAKGKDYWTQLFANATAKADTSCASAAIPDSYASFVKMADKFTVDFTQFPSVVGNAADTLRECLNNCRAINWSSKGCIIAYNSLKSFAAETRLDQNLQKSLWEKGTEPQTDLNHPIVKTIAFGQSFFI